MKHYFFNCLAALLLIVSTAKAQAPAGGWRIGFGIDPGIPTSKAFQYSLSGDIRLQKNFTDHVAATLTGGFTHYFEKDHFAGYTQYGSPFNVVPVKAGIKYFLSDNFYVAGEAGVGFGFEQWGNSFLWSPSVGLAFKNGIDLSVKYEDYTRNSATKDIALRLAYGFAPRKPSFHHKQAGPEGWQMEVLIDPGLLANNLENFTLGADVSIRHSLTNSLQVVATTGISHYFGNYKNYYSNFYFTYPGFLPPGSALQYITQGERNVIPVEAGLRFYPGEHLYLQGQAGAAFGLNGTATFMYTPSIGLSFPSGVDVGIKYDNYHSGVIPNVLSLKAGYSFKL